MCPQQLTLATSLHTLKKNKKQKKNFANGPSEMADGGQGCLQRSASLSFPPLVMDFNLSLEEVVEVVLENSLVISPLSCCVKKIHAASPGGHRGVRQMGAVVGKMIHTGCFLLHHSSWRVASESGFSARRTRRRTSRCFSAYEFVEGDDDSCVEAVALVGSGPSAVSTVIFSIPLLVVLVWVFFSFSVCTMVWLRVGCDTGAGRERGSRTTTIAS